MPSMWEKNLPQPSPGDSSGDDSPPTSRRSNKVDDSIVQGSVLKLLVEQRHEAEMLLERHHLALRHAVESALRSSANAVVPIAEALAQAGAPRVDVSTAEASAGTSNADAANSGEADRAVPSSANAVAPVVDVCVQAVAPKVDASTVETAAETSPNSGEADRAAPSANAVAPVAEAFAQAMAPKVDLSEVKATAGESSVDAARGDPSELSLGAMEMSTNPTQDVPPPADSRNGEAMELLLAPTRDAPPRADSSDMKASSMASSDPVGTPRSDGTQRSESMQKLMRKEQAPSPSDGTIRARLFSEITGTSFEALMGIVILYRGHFRGVGARRPEGAFHPVW